jgi:dienelactone hydrolase
MISFKNVSAYVSGVVQGASRPGIILLQEWWGINSQIKSLSDRYAQQVQPFRRFLFRS